MPLPSEGRGIFARTDATYPVRMLVAGVAAVLCLGGCSSSGDSEPGTSTTALTTTATPRNHAPTAAITMPAQDRTLPKVTPGVGMSEWLPYGALDVRALEYQKAGGSGAARSRIDVVTVEECADRAPATVDHTSWHLVDAHGRTLGAAGGKMVGRHPTEDVPRSLSVGQCVQTALAIAVPPTSVPVAVKDGSKNTWILAD